MKKKSTREEVETPSRSYAGKTRELSSSCLELALGGRKKGLTPSWKPWFWREPQIVPPRKQGKKSSPKIKNFAGCYEDSEQLFLEVLEYLEQNYDLEDGGKSSSVVMVPPGLRKDWKSFPNPYLSWTVSISRNASRKPCPRMLQQRNFGKPQKKVFGRK